MTKWTNDLKSKHTGMGFELPRMRSWGCNCHFCKTISSKPTADFQKAKLP